MENLSVEPTIPGHSNTDNQLASRKSIPDQELVVSQFSHEFENND